MLTVKQKHKIYEAKMSGMSNRQLSKKFHLPIDRLRALLKTIEKTLPDAPRAASVLTPHKDEIYSFLYG